MRIGITERGDAGLDMTWSRKLGSCDGVVLVTKNITNQMAKEVLRLKTQNYPMVLHATCTGWGGTWLEPNVPEPGTQLMGLRRLIDDGFPENRAVLRIDPVIPNDEGIERARHVLVTALSLGLNLERMRVRISVMDEYRHVKARLGGNKFYAGEAFNPGQDVFDELADRLRIFRDSIKAVYKQDMRFIACAEPRLNCPGVICHEGCVSETDLRLMGLMPDGAMGENPQGRNGCLCLSCKTELLENKRRCPNQCVYCYWRD